MTAGRLHFPQPTLLAVLLALSFLLFGLWVGHLLLPAAGLQARSEKPPEPALAANEPATSSAGATKSTPLGAQSPASPSSGRITPIVELARLISPAVVSVGAERTTYVAEVDPFFRDFFAPYFVYPRPQRIPYLGSGFLIRPDGHIVTNHHVIEGATRIFITLSDAREFEAKLLDADRFADIALLKIEGEDLPYAELGNSDDLLIGETVVAIGNPFGNFLQDPKPTVTAGVISAIQRSFKPDSNRQRVYVDMIQTDAAINPGNSGGPLVNLDRKVVGMNTFIFSTSGGGSVGLGFAIPANRIKAVVDEILKYGRLRPLLVDFDAANLSPRLAQLLDVKAAAGAVIRSLPQGGPGDRAGLKPGDVIIKADGRPITSVDDLYLYIAAKQVGEVILFDMLRGPQALQIQYEIEEAQPQGDRL